ncbi:M23 family metallopeptidase [Sphingomonas bacterium]|uniref:M23 family metallopeptidase n=1 Tax=Sphingomonas bacterium TaxID=1895847 RepID=UPI0020C6874C|nr:M23 family metallopeptidase [Sphingomonas bacterium]
MAASKVPGEKANGSIARSAGFALVLAGLAAAGAAKADPADPISPPAMVASTGTGSSIVATGASAAIVVAGVVTAAEVAAETHMRSLFDTWKQGDGGLAPLHAGIAIPSVHPVDQLEFTSNFGIRSDPFRHTARMHAGVDIRGPVGTPIYATADGTVDRAERAGGYGNLIELDHGKGIQTRYGHLSKILVEPGSAVKRGQLIALMGSTGRSTGSHLHYEVRIDGKAVNPAPFLTTADYLTAAQSASATAIPVVMDGPSPQD